MSDATSRRLKVSREGVVLIKSFEGFRPRAVRDEDGRWVIGYGHTASAREGLTVSESDAELLLQYDLLPVVKALNEQVSAPLNQHQFDALASFAISVGVERFLASDVLQRLNDGRLGEAADALINWPEATPPDARLRRRAAERALFVADPEAPIHLADLLAAPLPPPPVEESTAPEAPDVPPPAAPADARAAAVAALLGEAPPPTSAGPEAEPGPEPVPLRVSTPVTTIHLQRYSPYAAPMIGPLPGLPTAPTSPPAREVQPSPAPEVDAEPGAQPEPAPGTGAAQDAVEVAPAPPPEGASAEEVVPLVPPAPGASPFPPMDEPLVLTPPTEADFVEPSRPVWGPEQRGESATAQNGEVLFGEEPTEPVLRHEVDPVPTRRLNWIKGTYALMGLVGLFAFAASAAAFRLAIVDRSGLNDYTLIGGILALIGAVCVGVSSWNLFVHSARRD